MVSIIPKIIMPLLAFLAILFGFYLFSRNWKDNSKLEKRFSKFYKDLRLSQEFFPYENKKKLLVIIETEGKYEKIRTFVKKAFFRIKGIKKLQVIYIFHKDTFEEKEATLIYRLIADEWNRIEILDMKFLEAMINYFAYKYAHDKRSINERVKLLLRKEFESCLFREYITKLDNPDYEDEVVINIPPKKKPLLQDIILPLALDQNKNIGKMSFAEKESIKAKLMKIIIEVCRRECGILFIGNLPVMDYCNLLRSNFYKYRYFLLSARGKKTFVLENMFENFKKIMPGRTRNESTFEGTYHSRQVARKNINYKYALIKKIEFRNRRH